MQQIVVHYMPKKTLLKVFVSRTNKPFQKTSALNLLIVITCTKMGRVE